MTSGIDAAPNCLVVGDDRAMRKLLILLMDRAGFVVHEAADGETAFAVAALVQPSVMLVEMRPPGFDGLAVCRRLRADPATRGIPVVLVSGEREVDVQQALDVAADAYVARPFEQAELLDAVKRAMAALAKAKAAADAQR